jgi:hypothetical protein
MLNLRGSNTHWWGRALQCRANGWRRMGGRQVVSAPPKTEPAAVWLFGDPRRLRAVRCRNPRIVCFKWAASRLRANPAQSYESQWSCVPGSFRGTGSMFELHGFSHCGREGMNGWPRSSQRSVMTLLSLHFSAGAGYSAGYVFAQPEDWQVFYKECWPRWVWV